MPTQDLISRAARFFVLAEQVSRLRVAPLFWELSAPLMVKTAVHLPAMAAAVRVVWDVPRVDILEAVASQPLPAVLPPKAVRWYNRLVAAWEIYRASSNTQLQNLARLALVRLDGCGMPDGQTRPSRLPEWLTEARKIASGEWRVASGGWRTEYHDLQDLAALAAWRPAPRVITPPETLRKWVAFWMERRQSENPVERGIAAIALLNLPEADLRAAFISPLPCKRLLQELAAAIPVAAKKTLYRWPSYLSMLDWQPVRGDHLPIAEVRNVAQTWLEVTGYKDWYHRFFAWRQLIRWDRAGSLDICGMDLLPELVKAVLTEEAGLVLWEMAQWSPAAELLPSTGTPGRRSLLQQPEGTWERHRRSLFWISTSAWLAGIRLHQAGLASEPPESFLNAYLSEVADKQDEGVLFILAQWSPGAAAPGRWHREWRAVWQQRLLDKDKLKEIQQIAAWALLRQSIEKGHDRSLRCAALELWRTETKVLSEVKDTLNVVPSRLHEVRTRLAAGEVVDFEAKPARPAERHRPPLALPPGRIAGGEWKMENEEWKMENGKWRVVNGERRVVSSEF